MIGVSVSIQHSPEQLKSHNFNDYEVGIVLDCFQEDDLLAVSILLHDSWTAEAIKDLGLTGLSPGSDVLFLPENSSYGGVDYTYKKTQIRYNHLAFCDPLEARGGLKTRVLDSKDLSNEKIALQFKAIDHTSNGEKMGLVKVGNSTFSVSDEIATSLQNAIDSVSNSKESLELKIQDSVKSVTKLEGDLTATKAALEQAKQDNKALKNDLPELLDVTIFLLDSDSQIKLDGAKTSNDVKRLYLQQKYPDHYSNGMGDEAVNTLFGFVRDSIKNTPTPKSTSSILDSSIKTTVDETEIDWEQLTQRMMNNN